MTVQKFDREYIESQKWGRSFLEEVDLVVAINTLHSMRTNVTLYQDELTEVVANNVIGLDHEAHIYRVEDVNVPTDGNSWDRLDRAKMQLSGKPRGHWALVKIDQNGEFQYGRIVSDGLGGVLEDKKGWFGKRSYVEELPEINLYASIISYMVYSRREKIKKEIASHSFQESGIEVGSILGRARLNGKEYSSLEVVGIDNVAGADWKSVNVKCSRRGAKPDVYIIPEQEMINYTEMPVMMPPQYKVDDASERLHSRLQDEAITDRRNQFSAVIGVRR